VRAREFTVTYANRSSRVAELRFWDSFAAMPRRRRTRQTESNDVQVRQGARPAATTMIDGRSGASCRVERNAPESKSLRSDGKTNDMSSGRIFPGWRPEYRWSRRPRTLRCNSQRSPSSATVHRRRRSRGQSPLAPLISRVDGWTLSACNAVCDARHGRHHSHQSRLHRASRPAATSTEHVSWHGPARGSS
jgi:hypothetical protein